jgi:hypothetical protein
MTSENKIEEQESTVKIIEINEKETNENNINKTPENENLYLNRFEKLKKLQSLIKKESAMKELCKNK